ncbi:hypothetical protein [Deinococcus ruber]|uniref:Uncharacterized protein n=1 Tax=Deinococcus ruber TaxID=1848197 RepID=A0A918F6R2_9DEIO|nr:hypothetical protein [Deinococcus ruber]GGR13446.1 hypothetical protein GCM10008957_28000 [Deinococcus ruber]
MPPAVRTYFCGLIALTQVPGMIHLLWTGYGVPVLVATVLGLIMGVWLRPKVQTPNATFVVITLLSALWMAENFYPQSEGGHVLDQCLSTAAVVVWWPGEPGQRLRKRVEGFLKRLRRWSTGMPLPT